jgi:hypothetical protein
VEIWARRSEKYTFLAMKVLACPHVSIPSGVTRLRKCFLRKQTSCAKRKTSSAIDVGRLTGVAINRIVKHTIYEYWIESRTLYDDITSVGLSIVIPSPDLMTSHAFCVIRNNRHIPQCKLLVLNKDRNVWILHSSKTCLHEMK